MKLEFISNIAVVFEVEKVLSENFLYRPTRGKGGRPFLRLDESVRAYKETLKDSCESTGFHEYLTELQNCYINIAVISKYTFFIPEKEFFFQDGRIGRADVTNMLKAVEDTVLGTIIDDSNVLQTTILKSPYEYEFSTIVAEFDFFQYEVGLV